MLETLVDRLDHGIVAYGPDLNVTIINRKAREILLVPPSMFLPGEPFEKLARLNAGRGGYGGAGDIEQRVARRMARARSFEPFAEDQQVFDGRDISVIGQRLADGSFVISYTDISARKRAERRARRVERRIRQLLSNTREGYWYVDPQGRTLDVNDALCRMLGRSREALLDMTIFDVVDDENRAIFERQLQIRKQGAISPYEIVLRHADGFNIPCINSPSPIYDEDGELTGSVGLWTDISALKAANEAVETANRALLDETGKRRELHEQLEASNRDLEQIVEERTRELAAASKAKSEFLTNMSHELRTPLNAIIGFSDLMANLGDALTNDVAITYSQHILASGEHLLDLINDLLNLGKIEEGRYQPDIEQFEIETELLSVCNLMGPIFAGRHQEFDCDHAGIGGHSQMKTDKRALRQILINLLSNASAFSPEESVIRGTVRTAGQKLVVEIRDNGPGLEPGMEDKAFERFERLKDPLYSNNGGAGIGLPLSRELAEALGGRLWLESKAGKGTTAVLELPIGVVSEADAQAEETPPQPLSDAGGPSLDVLVVEDNPINQELIMDMITRLGHHGTGASDGQEAVEACRGRKFDLVLIDILMPRMNGLDASRAIRRLPGHADTPIVAVSANAMPEHHEQSLAAGIDEHLDKPLSVRALTGLFQRLADRPAEGVPRASASG